MLISIITINYNNLQGLKNTMNSVFEQSYKDIEYIIIDGGSTDGSKDFIESKKESLYYWVSEKDGGIYDAMNKGIDQATGNYLLFLNSGDWLVDKLVVEKFVNLKPIEDIVYGDPLVRNGSKWKRKSMPKEMNAVIALTNTLNHQAIFYSSNLTSDNFRYNTSYKVISDWIFTNDAIILKNGTTRYIDLLVSCFENPGISSDFSLRNKERKRYLKENFDPMFLNLLKEYKLIRNQHNSLKNSFLVRIMVKMLQKKGQFIQYFKK
ncbi:glycosyltransferase family 2 protein [Psychroserpens sp. AS72]|uniref:glycosyltransferase family 2 protein n=1 Tax=Psychroserpens sp. AS72 TaxID=3135775 RepID=UPI0031817E0B